MLSDREKLLEFIVALMCGNIARSIIDPKLDKLQPQDIIQLTNEFRLTNKLDIPSDEFSDLIADMDAMMERISDTLIHLTTKGNLFKENFKN